MTNYLLAGGGTAGHVNPLLAVAEHIRATEPDAQIVVLGTAEGLESRLVPQRGFELVTIPKVPFPRRPDVAALRFPGRFAQAVRASRTLIRDRSIDVVAGFGGYVSTPAFLAARAERVPLVVHEANARPGLANRLGARFTTAVGVVFPSTPLPHSTLVGMPLRPELERIASDAAARRALRLEALDTFGFDPKRPVLLVTGGSLGARRINATVRERAAELVDAGWSVLHLVGGSPEIDDPGITGYVQLRYLDRMDLALACADAAIARSGSATVSELTAMQVPAIYIPYPVGNGEQRLNAASIVDAGGALLVNDADFSPNRLDVITREVLANGARLERMRAACVGLGIVDGTARTLELIRSVLT
ncbi:MAG TPA: UDP-N-acetylglucosamine--N-acetylmuramyl-(pentapeptide) pyrophosphoryl-undecaprenol N-acetylglucosamine transferase [Microbacteriaceae bacterium]|nr:UDP-N-acetylglucosamine--N-acetylmuramyl-(pentapeptide) pyrophosphoryl-undecaprenol N-acetylglucosamine transferase [Microbacteriaceae bacterium]